MGEETKLLQLTSWIIVIAFVIGVVFVIVIVFLCAALGKEALLLTIGSNSDILLQLLYCQHVFRNGKLEAMLKEAGALLE